MSDRLERVALTVFGLGRLRLAPGTWGSLPPVALVLLALALPGPRWVVDAMLGIVGIAFGVACVRLGGRAERHFGRKDPSEVVADEVAGQCLALAGLPWRNVAIAGGWTHNLVLAGVAFAAFRLFDIWKPPPARGLQRITGGWGILVDDLIAGVYAAAVTQLVARVVMG
jgi:phosphatidylglycerophosphatase A